MLIQGVTLGGGAVGRGVADATFLRGAGPGPVLGNRGQAVVQLQPGRAGALVPPGVAAEAGAEGRHPSVLHPGRQFLCRLLYKEKLRFSM